MKRIGDVIRTISIPIGTGTGGTSASEEAVNCPKCKDAGFIRYNVPLGHPKFGDVFPCDCREQEREARHVEDLRRLSNLGAFLHHDFASFDPYVDGVEEAYGVARAYADDPQGWLFFHGGCGAGKTHLAVAIALHVMEHKGMSVLFAVVPDLLDHLRSTFDPSSPVGYDKRFEDVRNAGLLILDDLGTENATPWAKEKLYQIFNYRYNEQLPTVVTSNHNFDRIEERVLSRLLDGRVNRYLAMDAQDYRRRDARRSPRPDR
jgi:DNA replication protein DnaC